MGVVLIGTGGTSAILAGGIAWGFGSAMITVGVMGMERNP
jgi:hypothetical protein